VLLNDFISIIIGGNCNFSRGRGPVSSLILLEGDQSIKSSQGLCAVLTTCQAIIFILVLILIGYRNFFGVHTFF